MPARDGPVQRLSVLSAAIWLGLLFVMLGLTYWTVGRGATLNLREDNPRQVAAELQIRRGSIFDSNGIVLAESILNGTQLERHYLALNTGPAVGYYSFRHGTAGVEAGLDSTLRGDGEGAFAAAWRTALHQPQVGRDVRLTLVAEWQQQADALFGDRTGALTLLSLPEAAVRVMVSHPSYDPNLLDEQFEALATDSAAPLLNRATQGLYQPGLVLAPFILAGAFDRDLAVPTDVLVNIDGEVDIELANQGCQVPPLQPAGWSEALAALCPAPWAALGRAMAAEDLGQIFGEFGFYTAPTLPLATNTSDQIEIADPERSALGQAGLTVSPLQVALALAALAGDGQLPQPRLVAAVTDEEGVWQPRLGTGTPTVVVAAPAAQAALAQLPRVGGVIEFGVTVLSGPGGSFNSWYLALAPAEDPQLVMVIVLEGEADATVAVTLGRAVLDAVLFGRS